MKLSCPKCSTRLEVGVDIEGSVACPSCSETLDISALRAATCPICGSGFEDEDEIRICPDCKTPHHDECWGENHGCSTYGCASAAHQETHTADASSAGIVDNAGMIACPACGTMHPATDLVCGTCGKLLGDNLSDDSVAARLRDSAGRVVEGAKQNIIPRLGRNFRLLGCDIAVVFRLWLGEFARYGVFKGTTSRKAFVAFVCVNCVALCMFSGTLLIFVGLILALILPTAASCVRRLRDTDISPWMIFALPLLPFLLLVPTVTSSDNKQSKEAAT